MESVNTIGAVDAPRFFKQWLLVTDRARFFRELVEEFGDFVHCRGFFDFYFVNDPELVKAVLRETNRNYNKDSPIYRRFREALGKGVVNAEGDQWRKQRKALQETFRKSAVSESFNIMKGCANDLVDRLDRMQQTQNSVLLVPEIQRTALIVVGRALFTSDFDPYFEQVSRWTRDISYYSARLPIPILSQPWSPTPSNFRLRKSLREFGDFMQKLIRERIQNQPSGDLFDLLLGEMPRDGGDVHNTDTLADEALGMIVGGHETTANAIYWAIYEMSQHPEVLEKLSSEIRGLPHDYNHSDLSKLTYLEQVITESMRLHPPFWFENRNVCQSTMLGTESLEPGTMVVFSRDALHRNKHIWSNPDRFDPSRFDVDIPEAKRSSGAYVPFGGGQRICIGRHFAMMEIKVVLISLLREFDFNYTGSGTPRISVNLTLEPDNALPFVLRKKA